MNEKKKRGFAANPEKAREVAKQTKQKQSPEERSHRARLAAKAKWEKYHRDGLAYEDSENDFGGDK